MRFKVYYFRNPLDRAWPRMSGRGMSLVNRGMRNIKRKIMKTSLKINPTTNAKRVIHGFAFLYGFKYRKFMQDNFVKKRKYMYFHEKRCQLSNWAFILQDLRFTLDAIQSQPNMSTLLRSKYAKDIRIANIKRYYHPRKRRFVKNERTKLARLGTNRRHRFTALYKRFGSKANGQLTILLTHIKYHGIELTDHLWFTATKQFRSLGRLNTGDMLSFMARVKTYKKGFLPNQFVKHYDFKLSYPSRVKIAKRVNQ